MKRELGVVKRLYRGKTTYRATRKIDGEKLTLGVFKRVEEANERSKEITALIVAHVNVKEHYENLHVKQLENLRAKLHKVGVVAIDKDKNLFLSKFGQAYSLKRGKLKCKLLHLSTNNRGYKVINFDGKYHLMHRLVIEHFGTPSFSLINKIGNHKLGDKLDNRAHMLEATTSKANNRHTVEVLHKNRGGSETGKRKNKTGKRKNKTGHTGVSEVVYISKKTGDKRVRFKSKVKVQTKQVHLGTFKTLKEASEIYKEAVDKSWDPSFVYQN